MPFRKLGLLSKSRAYTYTWLLTENKQVSERNIGAPLMRKYGNYRTYNALFLKTLTAGWLQ
jgi:hypothetical protein